MRIGPFSAREIYDTIQLASEIIDLIAFQKEKI
jgi:hypothetical protein